MFKRILFVLLVFTLVAAITPSMDQASASGKTYFVKIISGTLNVRNKPSTSGTVIFKLSKGQQVTVNSQGKGWARITANGKLGYVSSSYIAPKLLLPKRLQ